MREYILEKVENTPKQFLFGRIKVDEIDPMPENINLSAVLKAIEKKTFLLTTLIIFKV